MLCCNNCSNISTRFQGHYERYIIGFLRYFEDPATLKKYVKKCCISNYGFNQMNENDAFYDRLFTILKINNPKYILFSGKPIMVYELKYKSEENIKNIYDYVNVNNDPKFEIFKVRRCINLIKSKSNYEFITLKKYKSLLLTSKNIIKNEVKQQKIKPVEKVNSNSTESSDEKEYNYIYLLQDRTAVKLSENIYKIGKTTQPDFKRFRSYPKGYNLLLYIACENCHSLEKTLIDLFKIKYIQRQDYGSEYFEGDHFKMMNDITFMTIKNNT